MSISKKRKSWKSLSSKTSLTRKMWTKLYSKCIMPKQKAYSSKIYKKYHGIATQKLSCTWSKSKKNGSQIKSFQSNVNTLVGGHICSFLLVRKVTWLRASYVWLDWINHWNFILDFGLVHTWFTCTQHIRLIFNECLFHLCDCTCSNVIYTQLHDD